MSDSFFDMPAGYTEADIDMAALEAAGNRLAKRRRRFGAEGWATLESGGTIEQPCKSKESGELYSATVRLDSDGIPEYTVDGHSWHSTARAAYAAGKVTR